MPVAPTNLRLRHAVPDDAAAFAVTMEGETAIAGTLQLPYPSPEAWRERLAKPDPGGVILVAEVRASEDAAFEIVAHAGLHAYGPNARRSHARGLGMSVRDDWQGRGLGAALLAALVDRADNWMNVLRLELTVFSDNQRAIALYERFGFVVEGRHRAFAMRHGRYEDALAMARLHPRPPTLPAGGGR